MGCTGTDPGGSPVGSSLYAQYYSGYFAGNQSYFSTVTPGLTRVDANVLFSNGVSFGPLQPTAGGTATDPDAFSLRQRGSLRIATAGTYTFYLTADDAAYLWLDNAALGNPPAASQATIDNGGDARATHRLGKRVPHGGLSQRADSLRGGVGGEHAGAGIRECATPHRGIAPAGRHVYRKGYQNGQSPRGAAARQDLTELTRQVARQAEKVLARRRRRGMRRGRRSVCPL